MKNQIGKLFRYGAAYGVGYGMGYGYLSYKNNERMKDYRDKRTLENEGNTEGIKQWGEYMDVKWGSGNY